MTLAEHAVRASARGPMPGLDPFEATRIIQGELGHPHLPHLVELPARGVGSDITGRTAGMLEELHVDAQSYGWRLTARPGRDAQRIQSALRTDLGATADVLGAASTPAAELKIRILGPLTLAKELYLGQGERALSDHGARRDLADSLALGVARHVERVRSAAGVAGVTVEIAEPDLAAVLTGTVRTVSGYRTLRAVGRQELTGAWSALAEALSAAGAGTVVSTDVDSQTLSVVAEAARVAGIGALGVNVADLDSRGWECLAGWVEGGRGVWLGLLDPDALAATGETAPRLPGVTDMVRRVHRPWRQLGLPDTALPRMTLMPASGCERLSLEATRAVLGRTTQAAEALSQIAAEALL